ncbi:hypothetical protein K1719_010101 [Acacia pycnantha]|nr:hypothetical protein K1719_010101 [Acacia pycnantha]
MSEKQRTMEEEGMVFPVSPMAQYFDNFVIFIYVIGFLELQVPFDESQALHLLHLFLPINPRFSSIMNNNKEASRLWEVHIVNYPTSSVASSLIFKLHHALGDGYSVIGALFSCLQRADHPSLPLSFSSLNTLVDFW